MFESKPSALVLTLSQVTRIVFVSDRERLGDAALALSYDEVPFRPVRAPGGYTCLFGMGDDDPFATHFAENTAAILDRHGFFAFGYEIFHDHTVSDTDAFQRPFLSGVIDSGDYGTAIVSCAHLDGKSEVWVFGHPRRLEGGMEAAEEVGIEVEVFEGPDGPLTLTATFPDRDRAEQAARTWSEGFDSAVVAPFAFHP